MAQPALARAATRLSPGSRRPLRPLPSPALPFSNQAHDVWRGAAGGRGEGSTRLSTSADAHGPGGPLTSIAPLQMYVASSKVAVLGIVLQDVPNLFPADGTLSAVKLICDMEVEFPIVGASITVSGEELWLFFNGTEVGAMHLNDMRVARGGQAVRTTAEVTLIVTNLEAASQMGQAAMYQRELEVQMAGTIRAKVLGKSNGCMFEGKYQNYCIDGWIPQIHVAKASEIPA